MVWDTRPESPQPGDLHLAQPRRRAQGRHRACAQGGHQGGAHHVRRVEDRPAPAHHPRRRVGLGPGRVDRLMQMQSRSRSSARTMRLCSKAPSPHPRTQTHTTSPGGASWICSCTHPSLFDIGVGGLGGMWDVGCGMGRDGGRGWFLQLSQPDPSQHSTNPPLHCSLLHQQNTNNGGAR